MERCFLPPWLLQQMFTPELYNGTWLRKLRDKYVWVEFFMGFQAIASCQLTGINSQTSMSAAKKCRAQADKNSLIFLASALVHIFFLQTRGTRRETVITSDRTHSALLLLFWQCEQFFISIFLVLLPEPAVEVCGGGVKSVGRIWILTTRSGCLRLSRDRLQCFGSSTAFPIHF